MTPISELAQIDSEYTCVMENVTPVTELRGEIVTIPEEYFLLTGMMPEFFACYSDEEQATRNAYGFRSEIHGLVFREPTGLPGVRLGTIPNASYIEGRGTRTYRTESAGRSASAGQLIRGAWWVKKGLSFDDGKLPPDWMPV